MQIGNLDLGPLAHLETSFYLGWGTLSLIVAGIAQGKGRSGFGWWLAALLLGPVALFLLLLCERKARAIPNA